MAKPTKNIGLGRGLDAIFETEGASFPENAPKKRTGGATASLIEEIRIGQIRPNPNQPRSGFDEEARSELDDWIGVCGVTPQITGKKEEEDKSIINSGGRRWRASKMAGLESGPT